MSQFTVKQHSTTPRPSSDQSKARKVALVDAVVMSQSTAKQHPRTRRPSSDQSTDRKVALVAAVVLVIAVLILV